MNRTVSTWSSARPRPRDCRCRSSPREPAGQSHAKKKLAPRVFIIESLDPDDEGNGRFEGGVIATILRFHRMEPTYRYIRSLQEFQKAVRQFGRSGSRYLHISAHGNQDGMYTTNEDGINPELLGKILKPHLKKRRLFLSACEMMTRRLAKAIIPSSGCLSVIGPRNSIRFADAAIAWSSIYHLIFSENTRGMTPEHLRKTLRAVCSLFAVQFRYAKRSTKEKQGFTMVNLPRRSGKLEFPAYRKPGSNPRIQRGKPPRRVPVVGDSITNGSLAR